MRRTALCPVCRDPVDTAGGDFAKCLIPNRSIEGLVSKFRGLRSELRDRLAAEKKSDAAEASPKNQPAVAASGQKKSSAAGLASETRTPRARRGTRATYKDDDDEEDDKADEEDTDKEVEVCERPPTDRPRLLKKRLVAYRALKKKQLQELCAKEGLSTAGNDKELIARHETFTTLYNSECDSFQPRSHQKLLQELKRREKAREDEAMRVRYSGARDHSQCMEQLKERRKEIGEASAGAGAGGDGENALGEPALTSGNVNFDAEVKANFAKLIEQGRQAMQKRKTSSESNEKEEGGSSERVLSADAVETPVAVGKSDCKVAGDDSKTTANSALSSEGSVNGTDAPVKESEYVPEKERTGDFLCSETIEQNSDESAVAQSSTTAAASGQLPEKLVVKPTSKRKATSPVQRSVRPKQKNIASLPVADSSATKANGRPRRLLIGPWECQVCTFVNKKRTWSNATCEMCSAKRVSQPNGVEKTLSY